MTKTQLVQITAMRRPPGICDDFILKKDDKNHYLVVSCLQLSLVSNGQLCDSPASMASSGDTTNKKASCPHLRLVLEQGATTQYLSGHYVCEQCGLHFDRPPLKPAKPPKSQEPPHAQ
jgi:hypothetical protein